MSLQCRWITISEVIISTDGKSKSKFTCARIKYTWSVPFSQQFINDLEENIEDIWISFLGSKILKGLLAMDLQSHMPHSFVHCSHHQIVHLMDSLVCPSKDANVCTSYTSLTMISFSVFSLSFPPSLSNLPPMPLETQILLKRLLHVSKHLLKILLLSWWPKWHLTISWRRFLLQPFQVMVFPTVNSHSSVFKMTEVLTVSHHYFSAEFLTCYLKNPDSLI